MHVFSKHVFLKHVFSKHNVFSKRRFSTFCCFRNVDYLLKYELFLGLRTGVAFPPLPLSMVPILQLGEGPACKEQYEAGDPDFAKYEEECG